MNKSILILLFSTFTISIYSQNWTSPVNVSNMNDMIITCDFTIDNTGIIHCVWNVKHDENFGIIYYSFSTDDGEIWATPEDISNNDENYCTSPRIVHDSANKLFVAYDYNDYSPGSWGTDIYIVQKDSTGWGQPLLLHEGIHNRLAIDHNSRLYVFWHMGAPHNGEFYYKYFENDTWSQVFCPFDDENMVFLNKTVADSNNNLHCVGAFIDSNVPGYEEHTIYFKYDYGNNEWGNMTDLSVKESTRGNDIALDTNQMPHICWQEFTYTGIPMNEATFYSYFNGENWSEREMLVEDPERQIIEIDSQNRVHVADVEKTEDGQKLVYYYRPDGLNWEGFIVDQSTNVIFCPEFNIHNNMLYLVYNKSNEAPHGDVYITKLDLITSNFDRYINYIKVAGLEQNYPNPFRHGTRIDFSINKGGKVKLVVKDLMGRKIRTLVDEIKEKGEYSISWDGRDEHYKDVASGIYLYTLKIDKHCITRSMYYIQ